MIFNNVATKIISVSSFFANYEFESEIYKKSRRFAKIAQKTTLQIEQLTLLHKKLQKNIQFLVKRSALYVNKKRNKDFTFKKKNKVYLLRRNIKTKRSSNKLNHIKLESFRILKTRESINFKLNLSAFEYIQYFTFLFWNLQTRIYQFKQNLQELTQRVRTSSMK